MKKIGLLVAFLGLVSGAMYARGYNFSTIKDKIMNPVKSPATKSTLGSVGSGVGSTTGVGHNVSSISKSYTNATTEREW
jgi:hypothetical protein